MLLDDSVARAEIRKEARVEEGDERTAGAAENGGRNLQQAFARAENGRDDEGSTPGALIGYTFNQRSMIGAHLPNSNEVAKSTWSQDSFRSGECFVKTRLP